MLGLDPTLEAPARVTSRRTLSLDAAMSVFTLRSCGRARSAVRATAIAAVLVVGVACARDPLAPATSAASTPAFLLGPGEYFVVRSDTVDAAGNETTVAEYAAGTYADPARAPAGSVTIRTVLPASAGGSSKSCITSTVVRTETRPGWTATVKKAGGCDKEIGVELANAATRERAQFSFLMVAGKTRIDYGQVR